MKHFAKLMAVCMATTICLTAATNASAQVIGTASGETDGDPKPVMRVEEDWVAYVNNPDDKIAAPQIVNVMSPTAKLESKFALFEINHATYPHFLPGGFQVQSYDSDILVGSGNARSTKVLRIHKDDVKYTCAMQITADGKMRYEMINGRSRTWGKFGDAGEIRVDNKTTLTDLNAYDPLVSLKSTTVNRGAHRLDLLLLKGYRKYDAEGKLLEAKTLDKAHHVYQSKVESVTLAEYLSQLSTTYTWTIDN